MDNVRPRASYSPIKRSYYTKPAFRPKNLKQDVKTSGVKNMTTARTRAVVNTGKGKMENDLKKLRWVWRPKGNYIDHESKEKGSFILKKFEYVDPKGISKSVDHAVVDSGCSSHMTGNKAYLSYYEDYNGGFMAFGSDPKGALSFLMKIKLYFELLDRMGKQQKASCKAKLERTIKKPLGRNYFLIDLFGPVSVESINKKRSYVSTATTPYISAASTPTGANAGESSFVYLGGQIPIDASTLPNVDLPIDPNMPNLEDDSNVFPNDGIFSGAYDDEDVGAEVDFNNMDNTIDKVWILVDLPFGKKAIGTKWVFKNKRDEQSIVVKNKARLVAQGFRQEEGIDYDEFFAPVARIEAIRLFLAFASFMVFPVYKMNVKSVFLYGTIEEEVKQQPDGIFISQDKYVANILKKFDFCSIKIATTPIELNKPLVKDEDGVDVDVHVYRSMIGSLMYLTASRPDIMFVVCACARFQVTLKASHLNTVKRIFRYLKHQPKLGLWYPRDSPFVLEAFSNSDYGGASIDRKSTIGGCQFPSRRLISWQCKMQTIVTNSTTEAEYVAAANFKNPVYHSRTKNIEIRHHFIRDCYEKRLIDVIKIHTDANVADLLTKGFDVTRFKFLVMDVKRYVMLFGLRIKGLVCAAQKYLTMEMMFGLGKKMQLGLVLGDIKVSMANLEFVDQHNMVACLEKTEGNSDFHEIVDFLASSLIHHALTISPTIYTSYIEQFWNTASSQTVNDVKQINATVDSKAVVVTEASIRSSLLFNDADGTACLTNEAIFQNLALMGYEGDFNKLTFQKALFSPQWKFLIHTILHCLSSKSTSWNEFSINIASAVICLATNQKFNFSKLIFDGDQSPKTSSSHATTQDSRDSLEGTNGNEGDQVQTPHDSPLSGGHTSDRAEGALNLQELSVLCTNLSNKVLALESIKDAQAVEIKCERVSMKKRFGKKEYVSKQGRKKSKPESTLDDSTVFDDQDVDHGMEYMDTEEAVDEGRQRGETEEVKLTDDTEVVKDKSGGDKGGNAEELVSTTRPEVSTARPNIDATRQEDSVVEPRTPPTTRSIFDDEDITMAQTLIKMKKEKAKEKGVSIKDVDDSSRPARSILTLKPLPIIDPKYKGKRVLKESPVKKVKRSDLDAAQIAKDAEIARLIHEKELAEILYDEVQANMDASEELASRLQMEEREMYTIEERHNQLKKKTFEEIQALYIKEQERDADCMPIGSERDEKMIDKMNKKAAGMDEEEVPEETKSTKVEFKQEQCEENIRKRSASPKIVPDEEEEIDYEILGTRYTIVNWESAFYHTDRYGVPHDYYRVFRANGSSRYIKTFTEMVLRFDRLDFIELHSLVMQRFSTRTPEGIDLVLWGDLRIMFEETADDDIWKKQEKWIIKSWTFYENYGVHVLAFEDGTEIHMLAERRYPLIKETLERMMELRLIAESKGEAVFDLLRFIQKQIDEFGDQDGSEKDL
ncbi:putative ribonuclease H-like domain-containing protein [Tanacetum coccineum]|uniref:Ribonuclease H-like domain-containing protein n=1 Tax=Tanacetum coccineum TaxID=301880 RepID=A0ABQ4YAW7_9ASTR